MPGDSVLLVGGSIDDREIYELGLALYGFSVYTVGDIGGVRPAIDECQPQVVVFSDTADECRRRPAWR